MALHDALLATSREAPDVYRPGIAKRSSQRLRPKRESSWQCVDGARPGSLQMWDGAYLTKSQNISESSIREELHLKGSNEAHGQSGRWR
jgi:hypothetical protein